VITGASKINAAGTADTMTTFVLGQPMDAHSATDLGAFQGGNQDAGKGVRATLAFAMVQSMAATFVTVLTVQVKIGASKTNATGTAKTIRTFVLGQPMDAHGVTDLGAFQGVNQDAGNGVRTTLTFVVMQTMGATFVTVLIVQGIITGASNKINATGTADSVPTFVLGRYVSIWKS
jgi:hypothetical protein